MVVRVSADPNKGYAQNCQEENHTVGRPTWHICSPTQTAAAAYERAEPSPAEKNGTYKNQGTKCQATGLFKGSSGGPQGPNGAPRQRPPPRQKASAYGGPQARVGNASRQAKRLRASWQPTLTPLDPKPSTPKP